MNNIGAPQSGSIGSLSLRLYIFVFEVSWTTRLRVCPRLRPPSRWIRFHSESMQLNARTSMEMNLLCASQCKRFRSLCH